MTLLGWITYGATLLGMTKNTKELVIASDMRKHGAYGNLIYQQIIYGTTCLVMTFE